MEIELHTGHNVDLDSFRWKGHTGFPYLTSFTMEESTFNIYLADDGHIVTSDEVILSPKEERKAYEWFSAFERHYPDDVEPGMLFKRMPGTPITVGLVSCSARKGPKITEAQQLYQGDLFKKSMAWAKKHCDTWAILSAKLGLIQPDEVVEPYDVTMKSKGVDERKGWALGVNTQCYLTYGEETHYVLLCGELYRLPFEEFNTRDLPFEVPMKGLGLGEQKKWLITNL